MGRAVYLVEWHFIEEPVRVELVAETPAYITIIAGGVERKRAKFKGDLIYGRGVAYRETRLEALQAAREVWAERVRRAEAMRTTTKKKLADFDARFPEARGKRAAA
jgi:hypothetical protein